MSSTTTLALQAAGLAPANLADKMAALNIKLAAAQAQAMRELFGAGSILTLADYQALCAVKTSRANAVKYSARLGSKASLAALVAHGYLVLAGELYAPTEKSNAKSRYATA